MNEANPVYYIGYLVPSVFSTEQREFIEAVNELVCSHGQLCRQCEICRLQSRIAELERECESLKAAKEAT